VAMENRRSMFGRLAMTDRNIISVLGSIYVFGFIFIVIQLVYQLGKLFKPLSHRVRRLVKYLSTESAYRTIMIVFLIEVYLDILLGGLLNTENDFLLDNPDNWGINGDLNFSDQLGVILGNIVYITCMLFPFAAFFLLEAKYYYIQYGSHL
jgi:heme A synthase